MNEAIKRVELSNREFGRVSILFKIFRFIYQTIKYTGLVAALVFLASHEKENPDLGKTQVEFYTVAFSSHIAELTQDFPKDTTRITLHFMTDRFYQLRNQTPAWTLNYTVNNDFNRLIALLQQAEHFGLFPQSYSVDELQCLTSELQSDISNEEKQWIRAELEMETTRAALRFMTHLAYGIRVDDTTRVYQNFLGELPEYLNKALEQGNLTNAVLELQPDNREYVMLQKALARYIAMAASDTSSYTDAELKNSDSLVINRLIAQGYLPADYRNDSATFRAALMKFQKMHLIAETGELDKPTYDALTLNTSSRFTRIAVNLDRIRKDGLEDRNRILVNIPEFRLRYMNQRGEESTFNVMVGKTVSRTPQITSNIDLIVANPYWTVPRSITHNEIIPRLRKDSTFLKRNGFIVIDKYENEIDASTINWDEVTPQDFEYYLRQTNISSNALGRIKFLFPNDYSVYLHDTQSKRLFERRMRAYSHGCIRVQHPEDLAQLIVNDYLTKETEEIDVKSLISKRERKELKLSETLPIYIRYYTCTADSLGNIYYHPDIYSYDEASIQELLENRMQI